MTNIFRYSILDSSKSIWISNGQKIYPKDIKDKLIKLGLKNGDIIMGHFDFRVFGKLGDIRIRDKFYEIILNTILSVIGYEGALIIPTYSYSFCNKKTFNIKKTKPTIGHFSEFALEKYQDNINQNLKKPIFRSDDPIFSCVGFGQKAELILKDLDTVCFGDNSVFSRLYEHDAKLIGFGFQFAFTFMHFVERRYNDLNEKINYRFNKDFHGIKINEQGQSSKVTYTYFVRDLKYCKYNFKKIPLELEKQSKLKKVQVGSGVISLATAKDVYNVIFEMLSTDKYILLMKNGK